jgi:hypothetical protein
VLSMHHVEDMDRAIELVNSGRYGNQACLFTSNGASARKFRYDAEVGNVGIDVGWRRRWHFSRSAGLGRASTAICTGKGGTRSSSSRSRRWWWRGGRRSGRGNSEGALASGQIGSGFHPPTFAPEAPSLILLSGLHVPALSRPV